MSNVGLRRANNQDSLAAVLAESQEKWRRRGHLFMVADGMGAHAAGELASKLATDIIPLSYSKLPDRAPPQALLMATQDANTQIHSRGEASPDFHGMGTTCTVLLLLPQGAVLSHVGDSRAYRARGERIEQLTFDHSLVWEMRAAGQIADEEASSFIPKNIITRSLGPNAAVQVDLEGPFPLEVGDTFLLCSDGLSGQVRDEEMAAVLQSMPPAEAAQALIDLANLRGGPDNITVIVVRVLRLLPGQAGSGDSSPVAVRPVHPAIWLSLGTTSLAALGLLVMGHLLGALVALLAAVGLAVAAVVQRYGGAEAEFTLDGRPLGRGPYRSSICASGSEFADQLASVLAQLRDAALLEQWAIDWTRFNDLYQRVGAARDAGDHPQLVREAFHAIRLMLDGLKQQHARERQKGSDE